MFKLTAIAGLLLATAIFATIPISPQVTPRGLELSVDQAQAVTYGRARRVTRRVVRRDYRYTRRAVRRGRSIAAHRIDGAGANDRRIAHVAAGSAPSDA